MEKTVMARMEKYLNKSDDVKLDMEELEPLFGPEDSEVNLRYILAHAIRRSSNIFEIFSTEEKSDHLVASKKAVVGEPGTEGRAAREVAEEREKGITTKAICAGPRHVKELQSIWRTAKPRKSAQESKDRHRAHREASWK